MNVLLLSLPVVSVRLDLLCCSVYAFVQKEFNSQQVQIVQRVQQGQRGQSLPCLQRVHALLLLRSDHQHPVGRGSSWGQNLCDCVWSCTVSEECA